MVSDNLDANRIPRPDTSRLEVPDHAADYNRTTANASEPESEWQSFSPVLTDREIELVSVFRRLSPALQQRVWGVALEASNPGAIPAIYSEVVSDAHFYGMFCDLPGNEQERVWNFTSDAQARAENPKLAAGYEPLEMFNDWLLDVLRGADATGICQMFDISRDAHERYIAAYTTIAGVYAEMKAVSLLRGDTNE